jgi:manganese oxidase
MEVPVNRDSRSPAGMTALFVALTAFVLTAALAVAVATDRPEGGIAPSSAPVAVTLSEFAIAPADITASGTLTVTNDGSMAHDLTVVDTGLTTGSMNPGQTMSLDVSSLAPGTYEVICSISGHKEAGMVGTLTVGGAGGAEMASSSGHGSSHDEMTAEEGASMDEKMIASFAAFPAATEGVGNQLLEPTVLADGTKRFELTAAITDWEVEPGKVVKAWTYNGMVPGPMIKLEVGDKVEVELKNELPIMTDIHWHGVRLPNSQDGVSPLTQDPIMPGETFTYRFSVDRSEVAMYHAHAHGDITVPNGMLGAFIVGDVPLPAGRTIDTMTVPADVKLDQRIPMVLNDAGNIGLSLNGKSFPATAPITAKKGEWVAIDYFNEGLQIHPMHLHGMEQLVVSKDGRKLEQPFLVDTLNVAPGERYTVLVNATEVGVWAYHCHILTHAEGPNGMFGMVTVFIVEE